MFQKKKVKNLVQNHYDLFFKKIEYNLRELGFGDVSVNAKMKEFNKILYDILLKLEQKKNDKNNSLKLNPILVKKYFDCLKNKESSKFDQFEGYCNIFPSFLF